MRKWPLFAFPTLAVGVLLVSSLADGDRPIDAPPGLMRWHDATGRQIAQSAELNRLGEKVYQQRCATCHGTKGDGKGPAGKLLANKPRDFTSGVYKFRTTREKDMPADQDLFRSTTAGFPAHGMPSFAYLSEKERWALVYRVKAFYPKWRRRARPRAVKLGKEPKVDAAAIERGKQLYAKLGCGDCHGDTGRGDGPRAETLQDGWKRPIQPRDFTRGPAFRKFGWHRSDVARILVTGIPGTPMPSYTSHLNNPKDIKPLWDIAAYVEHLTKEARKKK